MEATDTYSSGTIKFVSDESFSPIIDEQREIFEFVYPKAKLTPIYSNELDGVNMLMKRGGIFGNYLAQFHQGREGKP